MKSIKDQVDVEVYIRHLALDKAYGMSLVCCWHDNGYFTKREDKPTLYSIFDPDKALLFMIRNLIKNEPSNVLKVSGGPEKIFRKFFLRSIYEAP